MNPGREPARAIPYEIRDEANIIISKKDNALVIPRGVLQGEDEVDIKGTAMNKRVKIKIGMQNLESVEVLEGVSETDEIVIPKEK